MICEKCGSANVRITGDMIVSFPGAWERKLTKAHMRSKEFEVLGVDWGRYSVACRDCCYVYRYDGADDCPDYSKQV